MNSIIENTPITIAKVITEAIFKLRLTPTTAKAISIATKHINPRNAKPKAIKAFKNALESLLFK